MEPRLFAGLDVSTQSCKLVVLDWREGTVVHTDAVNYDRDLPQYETRSGVVPTWRKGPRNPIRSCGWQP